MPKALTYWIRKHSRWAYLTLLALAIALLTYQLDEPKGHLNQDEVGIAVTAHAITQTGYDSTGQFLPFYFQYLPGFWVGPIVGYLTALILSIAPFSEFSIRLPSVIMATTSILLAMVLTEKTFRSSALTILAGLLTLATPALFMHARFLTDHMYPVPFILLWLICLKIFTENKSLWALFFSGLSLGVGMHSYHAAKIYMPLYFAASAFVLVPEIKKSAKAYAVFLIGFSLPLIIFMPWLAAHPDMLANMTAYVKYFDPRVETNSGIVGVFDPERLGSTLYHSYTSYLGPRILFLSGDSSLLVSTRNVGVFLLPVAIMALFGILYALLRPPDRLAKLVVFGLVTYPLGPLLVNEPERVARGLVVVPFMVILATYGIHYMWQSKEKLLRVLLIATASATLIQFGLFLHDYFGAHRERSYTWFNGNIGGALETGLAAADKKNAATLYVDQYIPFLVHYIKFYQLKHGDSDTPAYLPFNPSTAEAERVTPHSIIIIKADHDHPSFQNSSLLQKIGTITEPDGSTSFYIYYRDLDEV